MKKLVFILLAAGFSVTAKAQLDSALNQRNDAHHPDMQDQTNKKLGLNKHDGVMGTGTVTANHTHNTAKGAAGHKNSSASHASGSGSAYRSKSTGADKGSSAASKSAATNSTTRNSSAKTAKSTGTCGQ